MTRAISTVLDASLCLLLVSASALTLVGVPTDDASDPRTADEVAELLATSTARVSYEVGDENRTAHDTLAGLLATAAVASSPVDDSQEVSTDAFERAATTEVNRTLRRFGGDAQVIARTETPARDDSSAREDSSTRDDSPAGRVVAGERPPPNADVHAASFAVIRANSSEAAVRVRLTVRTWSG